MKKHAVAITVFILLSSTMQVLGDDDAKQSKQMLIATEWPEGVSHWFWGEQAMTIGWSLSHTYSKVTVAAWLANGGGPAPGVAYLMRAIGPGTTPSDELAKKAFEVPSGFDGYLTLFSDLHLRPGSYWLIVSRRVAPVSYANLGVSTPLSLQTGTDVRFLGCFRKTAGAEDDYVPASTFASYGPADCHTAECLSKSGSGFLIRVSGDPSTDYVPVSATAGVPPNPALQRTRFARR